MKNVNITIPFLPVLALIFITLKLVGTISWSWWWVTLPLWGIPALILAIIVGGGMLTVGIMGVVWCWKQATR